MHLQIGMLWFDDTPQRPLETKIELAATHYKQKYGNAPNVCYVHPSVLGSTGETGTNLHLVAADFVLPHHFWLGIASGESIAVSTVSRTSAGPGALRHAATGAGRNRR